MARDSKRPRHEISSDLATERLIASDLQPPAIKCSPQDIFNLPLTEDYLVIDTRAEGAFSASHLPKAQNFPTPAVNAAAAGIQLEAYAAAWLATSLEKCEPEQKSKAVVMGDSSAQENLRVLNVIAAAIANHPSFQRGRLQSVLVSYEGHDSVAVKYPFLPGKEWDALPGTYPSEVKPQLFLGSQTAARSRQVFEELCIGAVVNATKELPNYHECDEALHVDYLKLALEDDPLQDLEESIDMALPFIAMHLKEGRNVLVNCAMGQSRSVSVVLAHLMSTMGCGYDKALELVRRTRPAARPNEGFRQELRSLEGRLIYGPKK